MGDTFTSNIEYDNLYLSNIDIACFVIGSLRRSRFLHTPRYGKTRIHPHS